MEKLFMGVYVAGIVAEMIIRMPYDRQRRRLAKADRRVTAQEWGVLSLLFLGMFFVPLAYILTPWFAVADCGWPPGLSAIAGGTGVALLLGALWLFWRSHRDLGANWSPSLEIVSEHRLVTQGVYGAIRHPMYASQALWSIAQLLLLQNWVAGPASLVAFLPLYLVRVPQEESMMLQHFGDEYLIYCQRTGRLLPPLRGRR